MLQILVGFLQSWGHYFSSFLHCRAPSKATTNCGEQTQGCAGSGSVTIWRWCHEPLTWKRPSCWRKDAWPVNVTCLMHPWPVSTMHPWKTLTFHPTSSISPLKCHGISSFGCYCNGQPAESPNSWMSIAHVACPSWKPSGGHQPGNQLGYMKSLDFLISYNNQSVWWS